MVFTALQFVSFAFTPKTMPRISKEFHSTIGFLQNMFLFSSANIFDFTFILTECFVLLLVVIILVQENVEFAKFRSPDSKLWKYMWLVMSGYSQTCVTVFFIPITKMLMI